MLQQTKISISGEISNWKELLLLHLIYEFYESNQTKVQGLESSDRML